MTEHITIPRSEYETLKAENVQFRSEISVLREELKALRAQLSKDSHNSSKPPSSDGFEKPNRTQSQRESSGKAPGGQPGHKGATLMQREHADETVIIIPRECEHCGQVFDAKTTVTRLLGRRQVLDLRKEGGFWCIEYQSWSCECNPCGEISVGQYPEWATRPIQYGPVIQAISIYLTSHMMLPYGRVRECLADLHGCILSTGTLHRFNRNAYELLEYVEGLIQQGLINAKVAHFDETGINIKGLLHWLHVASTKRLTYYTIHAKRGDKGMDAAGVLPNYRGIAVHDAWGSYHKEQFQHMTHSLCNAHLLRDLTFAIEEHGDRWAKSMKRCLKKMKQMADQARASNRIRVDPALVRRLEQRYDRIMTRGFSEYPPPRIRGPKRRGRKTQPFGKNLLDRFYEHKDKVLVFLFNLDVPFDNNQAERDIRMTKVQQKISGCFRSFAGAQYFCRIRGYISTIKKQGFNVMDALTGVMVNNPPIPNLA